MERILQSKPVDFKLSIYLSEGFEILKKNYGKFLVGFMFTLIMSLIPFCSFLAIGNFYKFSRKVFRGQHAEASEIFNFEDFMSYLYLMLIVFGAVIVFEIPIIAYTFLVAKSGLASSLAFVMPLYTIAFIVVFFYFLIRGFYIPALISVGRIEEVKTAWKMSKEMTKGNGWNILLFAIAVSFLSQIGIIACVVGIIFTLPFNYVAQFLAYDDAMNQIQYDEITEIGKE